MPKEYEYHERKKAQENFEQGMKDLYQVPKDVAEEEKSPKGAKNAQSQTSESGPSRDSGEA
jgi:hypothetical protein